MARYMRRRNPDVLGVNLESALIKGLSVGATEMATAKFIKPLAGGFIPPAASSGAMAKVTDAVMSLAAGWGLSEVTKVVHRPWARDVKEGAVILFAAKLASILVPGVSLTGTIPAFPFPFMQAPVAAPVLPASNGNGTVVRAQLGSGTMGLL